MKLVTIASLAAVGGVLALLITASSSAGQKVTVGTTYTARQLVAMDKIEHTAWHKLLQEHVNDQGLVDYQAWHRSRADRQLLAGYLRTLSQADPRERAGKEARLAFWINAYNALTIEGILREYPTDSIKNHTAKLVGYNIWEDLLLVVGNRQFSLDQIEHEILRKLGEPRIHFAIVCASVGCPKLLNEAYTAERLDEQLTRNALDFFANPRQFQYDASTRTIRVSKILSWFGKDFGSTQAEQLRAIAPYLPDASAQRLARSGSARVRFLPYDWSLNDQSTKR